MNLLDRFAGYVSPSWQASRLAARAQAHHLAQLTSEQLATYPDAIPTRRDETPLAPGTTPDWDLELGRDRRLMCDRVRQLMRGNALARAIADRTAEAVCGTGYRLQSRVRKQGSDKLDEAWNRRNEDDWLEFCEPEHADVRQISSLHQLNELWFRGYMNDGEAGFVKLAEGSLRGFESDELGDPAGYWRPGAVDGLMLDDKGRPKTFKIFKPSMYVLWADRRTAGERLEVPAEDVIFRARRTRLGQTRGETAWLGGFWPLDQIVKALEALVVGTRMAACLGLVIKSANAFTLPTESDDQGQQRRTLRLTPGGAVTLKPGEDVTQVTPNALSPQVEGLLRILTRLSCAAWGQTLEIVLGDFGTLNLSSARANVLTAMRVWKGYQHVMAGVYTAQYRWWLSRRLEDGKIPYREDALRHGTHRWIRPKTLILDPLADAQADLLEVDAGFKTMEEVLEERGWTLEDWKRARKEQVEFWGELDLPRSSLTRDRAPAELGGEPRPEVFTQAARPRARGPQTLADVRRKVADDLGRKIDKLARRKTEHHVHVTNQIPERITNVQLTQPAAPAVAVHNSYLLPETKVQNQTLVNVDVDAEIKGADKRVKITRDEDGRITGAVALEADPRRLKG